MTQFNGRCTVGDIDLYGAVEGLSIREYSDEDGRIETVIELTIGEGTYDDRLEDLFEQRQAEIPISILTTWDERLQYTGEFAEIRREYYQDGGITTCLFLNARKVKG